MSVIAFALVVRSTTSDDHAAAKTARALWLAVSAQPVHVHDWDLLAPGIRGCKTCDTAMGVVLS